MFLCFYVFIPFKFLGQNMNYEEENIFLSQLITNLSKILTGHYGTHMQCMILAVDPTTTNLKHTVCTGNLDSAKIIHHLKAVIASMEKNEKNLEIIN